MPPMVDFIPFEYSYALYVGDVKEMKERFGELKEYGFVTNEKLLDKNNGWRV